MENILFQALYPGLLQFGERTYNVILVFILCLLLILYSYSFSKEGERFYAGKYNSNVVKPAYRIFAYPDALKLMNRLINTKYIFQNLKFLTLLNLKCLDI